MSRLLTHIVVGLAALFVIAAPGSAAADWAKDIVGTWTIVSNVIERPDGTKVMPYGPNPSGMMMLDGHGHFAILIARPDVPKFASGNRETGTPDENKAAVQGNIDYFGTYSTNDSDKTITIKIVGASFPNWVGTEQKRQLTVTGDEMQYVNPTPSIGGGTAKIVWKRAP